MRAVVVVPYTMLIFLVTTAYNNHPSGFMQVWHEKNKKKGNTRFKTHVWTKSTYWYDEEWQNCFQVAVYTPGVRSYRTAGVNRFSTQFSLVTTTASKNFDHADKCSSGLHCQWQRLCYDAFRFLRPRIVLLIRRIYKAVVFLAAFHEILQFSDALGKRPSFNVELAPECLALLL